MYIPAGTAYLNFNRGGSVQPFIGAGAGAALAKTEWKHTVSASEIFRQYRPDFKVEPSVSSLRSQVGVLRIVGGANFYPMKHVIVRTVAGYLNGSYGTVGVGFGF